VGNTILYHFISIGINANQSALLIKLGQVAYNSHCAHAPFLPVVTAGRSTPFALAFIDQLKQPIIMTYINHLNHFFYISKKDNRLSCTHFSMYIALFYIWNNHRFVNPFHITRDEVMNLSHIGSKSTYAKVLDELHCFGYIRHEKPKSKHWKSRITIVKLGQKGDESQLNLFELEGQKKKDAGAAIRQDTVPNLVHSQKEKSVHQLSQNYADTCPKIGLTGVPKVGPIIHRYIIEGVESERYSAHTPISPLKKNGFENSQTEAAGGGQNCNTSHVEKLLPVTLHSTSGQSTQTSNSSPTFSQVQEFFLSLKPGGSLNIIPSKWTAKEQGKEAAKFFSHYTAIGWKLGGTNPIVNWKAAARKWLINCAQHSQSTASAKDPFTGPPNYHVKTPPNDFNEPL
jgi:hypothetical protein